MPYYCPKKDLPQLLAMTKQKKKKKQRPRQATAQYVIAASPPQARGGMRKPANKGRSQQVDVSQGHGINAFHTQHLTLPRAIAPYSIVRTIQNFTLTGNSTSQIWCFVPFVDNFNGISAGVHKKAMRSFCGFKKEDTSLSPAANGIDFLNLAGLASGVTSGVECVPAAMTVRITCPSSLQNATGQFFLGRWSVAGDPRAYSSYEDMRSGFLSYGHPRPLTAARLAMRGVEVSSVARDMNACSEFLPLSATDSGDKVVTVANYQNNSATSPWEGFTPIFLLAEDSVNADTSLNVQVAVEWRWRFALDNVAASTHLYHKPSSPSIWSNILEHASMATNGVAAIAEAGPHIAETVRNIARIGQAVGPLIE